MPRKIENRFQEMQNECGCNPRKINSASKLSGCMQREQSKVIVALPTDNKQMKTFEKTLSGIEHISVNTVRATFLLRKQMVLYK